MFNDVIHQTEYETFPSDPSIYNFEVLMFDFLVHKTLNGVVFDGLFLNCCSYFQGAKQTERNTTF